MPFSPPAVLLISAFVIAGGLQTSSGDVFLTPTTYPGGTGAGAAAVYDLNDDGFADIVTANVVDKDVSVFLNDGKGRFGAATNFSVGVGAVDVAGGDLDGDGNADLVVTDTNTSAHVALGHGDGTFGPFSTITLHSQPQGIAIADLDADGIPDLAIAILGADHTFDGEVAVLIGQGDGTFAAPVFYGLGVQQGKRLVVADLNNDGKLDLAVAIQHASRPTNGLAILLGNGDGTFQSAVISLPDVNASDIAAADLNGDGIIDLALSGTVDFEGVAEVLLGDGDGTFHPAANYSTFLSSGTINIADMNGDGFLDLLTGGSYTAILLGDASGGFGSAAIYGMGSGFARVGFFNRDRFPDIVGGGESEINVAFGRSKGTIQASRVYRSGGYGLDSADFDGDAHPDVISCGTVSVSFQHGNGDGTLAEPVSVADVGGETLIAADFNSDGKQDVIALPFQGEYFYRILGNGDGTFQTPLLIAVPTDEPDGVVSDFNLDGKPDIALTGFFQDELAILLGNGDGSFQPAITSPTIDGPQQPTVADFNLDGIPDLAISHAFKDKVSISLGNGDGTFAEPLVFDSSNAIYLAAADLNGDGKPDLVVSGNGVKVFLGNGDGTFGLPETIYPTDGPVKIADIDLDGRPDIVLTTFESALLTFRGSGDGTFRPALETPTAGDAFDFVLKDLDGDGAPEAIVNAGLLNVLRNISRRHR